MPIETFTIGTLAAAAGVNVETVRYYERRGLLPQPERRSSGYRQYSEQHLDRLQLIRRAKSLGFTLADIEELITLVADGSTDDILRKARERASVVAEQQRELSAVRERLERLAVLCAEGSDDDCSALRIQER